MTRLLALGPGRTSVVVEAENLRDALVEVEAHGARWTAERRNALDVPRDAPDRAVDNALADSGWSVMPAVHSPDGSWTVHERARWRDDLVNAALAELARSEIEAFTDPVTGEARYRLRERRDG